MPVLKCPPGVWTLVPDLSGDIVVEAHGGCYLSVDGTQPADPTSAMAVPALSERVIQAAVLAGGVYATPAQGVKYTRLRYNLI